MLISDWSPDVFSSDLRGAERLAPRAAPLAGSGKKSRSRAAADVAGSVVGPLRAVAMSRPAAPAVAAVLLLVCAWSAAGSAAWAKPSADPVRRADIGRAACRARVCQDVSCSGVAIYINKKTRTYRK